MPLPQDKAWFAAKKYGWGWGLPRNWAGWAVLIVYLYIILLGAIFLAPAQPNLFLAVLLLSTAVLVAICYAKGEAPKWRWGDSDEDFSSRR